jgi:uncharacterized lipoprotein YddW (UPF0748 family)
MSKKASVILFFIISTLLISSTVLGASLTNDRPENNPLHEPERYYPHNPMEKAGKISDPAQEMRGTYIVSWRQMTSPEKIDQFIQEAADANFNTVFVQVRQRGDALYHSSIVSRSELLEGQDENFDPLAYAIQKGHEKGLEVHAWLNAMIAWGSGTTKPKDPNHIFNKHPEWLMRDSTGKIAFPDRKTDPVNSVVEGPYFLAPGNPEVQDHLYDVYMEVVENYDIDGIHFDFIRFPARMGPDTPAVSYDEVSLKRFKEETGEEPIPYSKAWDQWRTDQITEIVAHIYKGVKERKTEVEVSASVLAAWDLGLGRAFTDYRKWMEMGILDFVMPMSYSPNHATVWKDTTDALQVTDPGRVVVGLGAWHFKNNPEGLAEQIDILRRERVRGFVLFAQDTVSMAPTVNDYMQSLKELSLTKKVKVPKLPSNTFNVDPIFSNRDGLTIRVGEIDQWTRGFSHRFFVRNGKTKLIIENNGLNKLDIKITPILYAPHEFSVDVKGEKTVEIDISQYVNPDDYSSLANHTFLLSVDAHGPPGGQAKVLIKDYYTR